MTDFAAFQRLFADTSERHLLLLILHHQHEEARRMGALEDALTAEDATIQQIVTLVQGLNPGDLQAKLDAANAALTALQGVDDADKAALQTALDEIAAAAAKVTAQTGELQALVPAAPAPAPTDQPPAA